MDGANIHERSCVLSYVSLFLDMRSDGFINFGPSIWILILQIAIIINTGDVVNF